MQKEGTVLDKRHLEMDLLGICSVGLAELKCVGLLQSCLVPSHPSCLFLSPSWILKCKKDVGKADAGKDVDDKSIWYTHLSTECSQDMIHTEGFHVLVISRGNPMLII